MLRHYLVTISLTFEESKLVFLSINEVKLKTVYIIDQNSFLHVC